MINKETNEFKFNGFTWKLRAKIESNDGNSLKVYLKNVSINSQKLNTEIENDENLIELEVENSTNNANLANYEASLTKMSKRDIITIYYKMEFGQKTPLKELTLKNININTNEEILISKLSYEEWAAYKSKELGFTIYLNIENIHSTILLYIADNLKDYLISEDISMLQKEDLLSMMKYVPSRSEEQENSLFFLIKWGIINNFI